MENNADNSSIAFLKPYYFSTWRDLEDLRRLLADSLILNIWQKMVVNSERDKS